MKGFFYLPLTVLALAFLVICLHAGTPWPWHVVIHEDGHRTFLDTVFYFEHALGELPLELLLSAAVAGSMLWFYAPPVDSRRLLRPVAFACVALYVVIVAGACIRVGTKVAMLNLMQYHTRDDQPMVFGSHWRYHLLSHVALMLLPCVLVSAGKRGQRNNVLIAAWVLFAALTMVFGVDGAPFTDARYLGHQARELFTHTLVTIPMAIAMVGRGTFVVTWTKLPKAATAAFLFLSAYLAAGVLLTRSHQVAQSSDWVEVVCGHFIEHTLSYVVVPAHAVFFYLLGARRG